MQQYVICTKVERNQMNIVQRPDGASLQLQEGHILSIVSLVEAC